MTGISLERRAALCSKCTACRQMFLVRGVPCIRHTRSSASRGDSRAEVERDRVPFQCPRNIHGLVCDCTGERREVGSSK